MPDKNGDVELGDIEEAKPFIGEDGEKKEPLPVARTDDTKLFGFNRNAVFAVAFYWFGLIC